MCKRLNVIWSELQRKHVNVKFVKAVATSCVENFNDIHCPSMFIYKNGELVSSEVPAKELFGGDRMTVTTVEFVLADKGVIDIEFDEDPRDKLKLLNMVVKHGKDVNRHHEQECVDSDGDDREYTNNQY